MTNFAWKLVKTFLLTTAAVLLMTASAFAAEDMMAVAVGATTGSSLRLRESASTSTSIITTLNKNVAVAILDDSAEGWYRISYNGSVGYVSADYIIVDKDNIFQSYGRVNVDAVNVRSAASIDSEIAATLSSGTVVTVNGFEDGWYDVTCQYGTEGYIRSDFLDLTSASTSNSSIAEAAKQHLGTRYVWGGSSAGGFDCSGFTMYIYRQFGYSIPHTASGQWQSGIGEKISGISSLQPGDLVFFNDPSRNAGKACSHVGIYVGGGQFIHSSSSKNGVIYSDLTSGYYNTYYKGAIRV